MPSGTKNVSSMPTIYLEARSKSVNNPANAVALHMYSAVDKGIFIFIRKRGAPRHLTSSAISDNVICQYASPLSVRSFVFTDMTNAGFLRLPMFFQGGDESC